MKPTTKIVTGPMVMANGDVLTDADLERMAEEVEAYSPTDADIERLRRTGRRPGNPSLDPGAGESGILNVRLDAATRAELEQLAVDRNVKLSAVTRQVIRAGLTELAKKRVPKQRAPKVVETKVAVRKSRENA